MSSGINPQAFDFRCVPKYSTTFKTVWVKNGPRGSGQPRLTWTQTVTGDWLSVEVSLPKWLFERNTVSLSGADILVALNNISKFVTQTVGVEFDATTALVGRVDYFADFPVGEANLERYLAAAASAILPRLSRETINGTVFFGNNSKQIVLYDKAKEVLCHYGQLNTVMVEEAKGKCRLELRYRSTDSCKGLKDKHGCPDRTALSLLTGEIAHQELSGALSALGMDREILRADMRIDALRDCYGDTSEFRRLVGFLTLFDHQGEDRLLNGYGGYSRSQFYDNLRMVKKAGAWLCSDVVLPALHLPQTAFLRLAA